MEYNNNIILLDYICEINSDHQGHIRISCVAKHDILNDMIET